MRNVIVFVNDKKHLTFQVIQIDKSVLTMTIYRRVLDVHYTDLKQLREILYNLRLHARLYFSHLPLQYRSDLLLYF